VYVSTESHYFVQQCEFSNFIAIYIENHRWASILTKDRVGGEFFFKAGALEDAFMGTYYFATQSHHPTHPFLVVRYFKSSNQSLAPFLYLIRTYVLREYACVDDLLMTTTSSIEVQMVRG